MLETRDWKLLRGVHPALIAIVEEAGLSGIPFRVTEGVRSRERQEWLFLNGKSRTMNSRHLGPVGHAVDLAVVIDGVARWDWPTYRLLNTVMQAAATKLATPLEWGGEWVSFRDGCHWQLPWRDFPADCDLDAIPMTTKENA